MGQVGERGPGGGWQCAQLLCIYLPRSRPCAQHDHGVIIPISQMEILERLGHILNYIHPTHLGLSSPVYLLTCEGDGLHMGAPSFSSFLQIPEVLGLSSTH